MMRDGRFASFRLFLLGVRAAMTAETSSEIETPTKNPQRLSNVVDRHRRSFHFNITTWNSSWQTKSQLVALLSFARVSEKLQRERLSHTSGSHHRTTTLLYFLYDIIILYITLSTYEHIYVYMYMQQLDRKGFSILTTNRNYCSS